MTNDQFTPLRGESTQPGIEQRWDELRSKIKATWPELSNDDLKAIDGDTRKLVALVHQKTGADIHHIEEQIDEIASSSEGLLHRVARSTQEALSSASERIAEPLSQAYTSTQQHVAAAPGRSMGIAFGVGLIVGLCTASLVNDVKSPPPRRFW